VDRDRPVWRTICFIRKIETQSEDVFDFIYGPFRPKEMAPESTIPLVYQQPILNPGLSRVQL
jgi:hypothetical protein